jgi:SAM-dependent methyltransferase
MITKHLESELERVRCLYCDSEQQTMWARENGFCAVKCGVCGLVYVTPRPGPTRRAAEVERGIHSVEKGSMRLVGRFNRHKVREYRRRILEMYPGQELQGKTVRWLDVGCGHGELLMALQGIVSPASLLRGLEPCVPKVQQARERGLIVSDEWLEEAEGPFDVISAINLFSHLPEPARFLGEARRKLAPGGEFLLVTGNVADMAREEVPGSLYLPDHLVFAGEGHVQGFLRRAGFEILLIRKYRDFIRQSLPVEVMKNAARLLLRRPTVPLRNIGPFRSLYVRARLVDEKVRS